MSILRSRRVLSLIISLTGCLLGFAITVCGAFAWGGALFSSGTYGSATDPIMEPQNRRLVMFGVILLAFSAFGLMRSWQSLQGRHQRNDATNI